MQKIILKDNATIYIDEFNYNEQDGKCRIYDTNKEYLDYLEEDNKTLNDYLTFIKEMQTTTSKELAEQIIENNNSTYYYGESIEEILKEYKNDIIIDEESNEYIIDNINFDLEHLQGVSLNHWGINQIGNVYLMIF